MKTIVITDGKYRSAISAARSLGRAGYRVVVTQTRLDSKTEPPVFSSRYASETVWIEGSAKDAEYPARLLAVLQSCDHPALLCIGAASLNAVSRSRSLLEPYCDMLIAAPEVLDALNDKAAVHARALELGLPVPEEFSGAPAHYPVVIKPHCGEKFGLKAADRYRIAHDDAEYAAAMDALRPYDPDPIVQEYVSGEGRGASLLLDQNGQLVTALCHRRVREYPISGGPSACCESFYDAELVDRAYRLLRSFGFQGLAMVEFKGDRILEVNPRVWGSFPLTTVVGSPMAVRYAEAAAGEAKSAELPDYKVGVRMRFLLNDTLAVIKLFLARRWREAFAGLADVFRAREALWDRDDPKPFRRYLKSTILGK